MPDSKVPRDDVRVRSYAPAACPNCGRERLEFYVDGDADEERAVGLACEKCGAQWLLDPATADHHGEHSRSNPLRPSPPDNDPFGQKERSRERRMTFLDEASAALREIAKRLPNPDDPSGEYAPTAGRRIARIADQLESHFALRGDGPPKGPACPRCNGECMVSLTDVCPACGGSAQKEREES